MTRDDLSGQRFGRLIALSEAERSPLGRTQWLCRCDCGNVKVVASRHLKNGATKSCGCWHDEAASINATKHGRYGTRTYTAWSGMLQRCTNPSNRFYSDYGGRGIKVCERWRTFANFLADMGEVPEGMSIDRIDPNGDYEPSNCRWATAQEQARNRRSNRAVTFNGETKTLAEWAEKLGIGYGTLHSRLNYYGWDTEKAFTQKAGRQ